MISLKIPVFAALLAGFALGGAPVRAQQQAAQNPTQTAEKYAVELRVPAEGLYADDETDIEFHVSDTSQDDPVQGAPPVVKATVTAAVTMPAMPGMPQQTPTTHREGVPGDYGVVVYFPHGGEYQIALTITPPGDRAFTVAFKVPVKDAAASKNRPLKPKPYTLEVHSNPATPRAGEPADLTLLIRSRATHQPVTVFDIVHARQIHLVLVSKDLSHFAHEHPEPGPEGRFTLRYTFPTGGEYRLFADVAPHGAGDQVVMQSLSVAGAPPADAEPLKPDTTPETAGGVKVAIQTDAASLPARRTIPITFTLRDAQTNAPVTDLEPYLDAMGHLILIHQDGMTYVHSHPEETDPAKGHSGTLTFLARFPQPGFYKGWLQFQRAGQVQTVSFVLEAQEGARKG